MMKDSRQWHEIGNLPLTRGFGPTPPLEDFLLGPCPAMIVAPPETPPGAIPVPELWPGTV